MIDLTDDELRATIEDALLHRGVSKAYLIAIEAIAERRGAERILAAVRTEAKRLVDHGWDGDVYAGVELLAKRIESAAHHKETP